MKRPTALLLGAAYLIVPPHVSAQDQDQREAVQEALANGNLERSAELLAPMLKEHPDDPDLLRRRSAIEAARGDLKSALATIDLALSRAPDDPDLQLARANVLIWQGRINAARNQIDQIAVSAPGYPGLTDSQAALARLQAHARPRLTSLGVGLAFAPMRFVDGREQLWTRRTGSLGLGLGRRTRAVLEIEEDRRQETDVRISARLEGAATPGKFILVSATPGAAFRERWSLETGTERPLGSRTKITLAARYASYRGASNGRVTMAAHHRLGRHWSVSGTGIVLSGGGDHHFGSSARIDYTAGDRTSLRLAGAIYPDTEAGETEMVRSASIGAAFSMKGRLSLHFGAAYERRRATYRGTILSIGLGIPMGPR